MSVNDETVKVADQTTDKRTPLPFGVELVGAAEQYKRGVWGRGGEQT